MTITMPLSHRITESAVPCSPQRAGQQLTATCHSMTSPAAETENNHDAPETQTSSDGKRINSADRQASPGDRIAFSPPHPRAYWQPHCLTQSRFLHPGTRDQVSL